MVINPPLKLPFTPGGKFVKDAPVAPVVVYEIFDIAELTQTVWLFDPIGDWREIVLLGITLNVTLLEHTPNVAVIVTLPE